MALRTKAEIRRGLGKVVEAARARFAIPGVAVGILRGDVEVTAGYGVTNIDFPLPVDPETVFLIGSTTKTYTATAVMRLVEQGRLDLDDLVRAHIPSFKVGDESVAASVTVRDLLTHAAGWRGDYFDDLGRGDDALRRIVARMRTKVPQLNPPRTVWAYNNAGFYVAGRVIEVVTRTTYEQALRELVLDPLGLQRSFLLPEEVILHKHALGHVRDADGLRVSPEYSLTRNANPAGGLASTVGDQLRYARFHMGDGRAADGTRLLERSTLDLMQTAQWAAGSMAEAVGISWLLDEVGGARIVRHGGTISGQMSNFVMVPERDVAVTVLTNGDRGHELDQVVVDWALEHVAGVKAPRRRFLAMQADDLSEHLGRYRLDTLPGFIELTPAPRGRMLLTIVPDQADPDVEARLPPPVRVAFDRPDRVIVLDEPSPGRRIEFVRDASGAIQWLRYGGRLARRSD